MTEPTVHKPWWKAIIAGFLDFVLVFGGGGYVIALLTGGLTENGFRLEGLPALALFALVIGYFVVFGRYLGGTIFRRLFGIAG
jgi:hypothetical protein